MHYYVNIVDFFKLFFVMASFLTCVTVNKFQPYFSFYLIPFRKKKSFRFCYKT